MYISQSRKWNEKVDVKKRRPNSKCQQNDWRENNRFALAIRWRWRINNNKTLNIIAKIVFFSHQIWNWLIRSEIENSQRFENHMKITQSSVTAVDCQSALMYVYLFWRCHICYCFVDIIVLLPLFMMSQRSRVIELYKRVVFKWIFYPEKMG